MFLPGLWWLELRAIHKRLRKDDLDGALALARRYVRLRPRDPNGYLSLRWLLKDHGGGDVMEMEAVLRAGLARCGGDPGLSVAVGMSLARRYFDEQDDALLAEAEELFAQAARRSPSSPRPPLGRAWAAAARGDLTEARQRAEEARRRTDVTDFVSDEGYESFRSAVRLLLRIPDARQQAVEWLEEAAELPATGSFPDIMLSAFFEGRDEERAQRHLSRARDKWGGSESFFDELVASDREEVRGLLDHPLRPEPE